MEELIEALRKPAAWPFPVQSVEHLETHISHLFLVGEFAYKVKKPLDLGFLDFSTLEKRHFYCQEELRLNRRMAPGLYLAVVPITRDEAGDYLVEGEREAVEYAVKMRRFDQDRLFDRLSLTGRLIDELAQRVAEFHAGLPPAPEESDWGRPEKVWTPVVQNFRQIGELGCFPALGERLERLETRARHFYERLVPLLEQRKRGGWIRECHGDMHLGNIALVDDQVMVFDGIEFNPALRWIDTANDIAFLLMDLERRGMQRFAWRFLNRYLELLGDYQAVALLDFYKAYRAMVRAKVAAIRLAQEEGADSRLEQEFNEYLAYAETCFADKVEPTLYITFGLSGSGKSRFCLEARERCDLLHLRSDLERKRLFGLSPEADSRSAVEGGIYTPEATERTYGRLAELARSILGAGCSVVVDATFLEASRRQVFRKLAREMGAGYRILAFEAPEQVLRQRIIARAERGGDPSEADLAVLERQLQKRQPLSAQERGEAVVIDTTAAVPWEVLDCQSPSPATK